MVLYGTHNVIHLRITNNTALRVVVYLSKDKIDWYNENHLHPLVIEALYPIIVENIIKAQTTNKKKKETENNQTVHLDGFRLLYRFVQYKTHSKMITLERDFLFNEEKDDNKPMIKTKYKPMSIYPFQLLVSVDDQLFTNAVNTLDSYFTNL